MDKTFPQVLIVCTPGLEKELRNELQEVWPYLLSLDGSPQVEPFPEIRPLKGGIEIPCEFFQAVQLNFFLHLATRVLWRLAEFKCRDFPKLFQQLKKIPWNQWLTSSEIEWHVSAAKSRLNNEKRIVEVAKEVTTSVKIPKKGWTHDVYIRNFDDVVTVSLDLTGEPLYKRILSKQTGEAPFRETWANFILRRLMNDTPLGEIKNITVVDPFCGSGTFIFESLLFNFPNFHRPMAFQNLVRAPKLFKSATFSHNYKWPQATLFKGGLGFDQSKEMVQVAKNNLEAYRSHFKFTESPQFAVADALNPTTTLNSPVWLVTNPPWGRRLGTNLDFEEMVTTLAKVWQPQKMALVLPEKSVNPACISRDYELIENLSLSLGGTAVNVLLWQRQIGSN